MGLSLPQSARSALVGICRGLPGVRWQKPENFHVTLKFIGRTDEEGVDRVDSALKTLCAAESPVPLKIQGVGIFGEAGHPRALWAGVLANPRLLDLQRRIESALFEKAGFAPEPRPFHPHVTLAKPKKISAKLIGDYLEERADFALPEFRANEAVLFSSHGGPEGSEYRVERGYGLGTS